MFAAAGRPSSKGGAEEICQVLEARGLDPSARDVYVPRHMGMGYGGGMGRMERMERRERMGWFWLDGSGEALGGVLLIDLIREGDG